MGLFFLFLTPFSGKIVDWSPRMIWLKKGKNIFSFIYCLFLRGSYIGVCLEFLYSWFIIDRLISNDFSLYPEGGSYRIEFRPAGNNYARPSPFERPAKFIRRPHMWSGGGGHFPFFFEFSAELIDHQMSLITNRKNDPHAQQKKEICNITDAPVKSISLHTVFLSSSDTLNNAITNDLRACVGTHRPS